MDREQVFNPAAEMIRAELDVPIPVVLAFVDHDKNRVPAKRLDVDILKDGFYISIRSIDRSSIFPPHAIASDLA
jgi:hypothetical protein